MFSAKVGLHLNMPQLLFQNADQTGVTTFGTIIFKAFFSTEKFKGAFISNISPSKATVSFDFLHNLPPHDLHKNYKHLGSLLLCLESTATTCLIN